MVTAIENDPLNNPFWQFSLDVYAHADIAPKCLHLQEKHQIDVNLILFGLWLGYEGWLIPDKVIAQEITKNVAQWRTDVIIPLRRYRVNFQSLNKGLSNKKNPLRKQLKKLEIDAEQVEQAILYELSQQKTLKLTGNKFVAMIENIITLQPALHQEKSLLENFVMLVNARGVA